MALRAIAAMSLNRVIGRGGQIPWHIPDDFRWFKKMTTGQCVLMGRKTFESMGKPLPNRTNFVVTREGTVPEGVHAVRDLRQFDPEAHSCDVWVIGGAEIYRQMLGRCEELYLSIIPREVEGDVFFPDFESTFEYAETVLRHPDFEVRKYRNKSLGRC